MVSGGIAAAMFGTSNRLLASEGVADDRVTPIEPPADRPIRVAFLIGLGANVIDTAGPWEVFQDVFIGPDGDWSLSNDARQAFSLYTVGEEDSVTNMTGGMKVVPDFSVSNAPEPDVIVIPAQLASTPKSLAWLQDIGPKADVTTSVCTGAFLLAESGLIGDGRVATHHLYWDAFAREYPELLLERGRRFVDNGRVASAGGLTSGIDMALHIVSRYFGDKVASATARYMEYQSDLWRT